MELLIMTFIAALRNHGFRPRFYPFFREIKQKIIKNHISWNQRWIRDIQHVWLLCVFVSFHECSNCCSMKIKGNMRARLHIFWCIYEYPNGGGGLGAQAPPPIFFMAQKVKGGEKKQGKKKKVRESKGERERKINYDKIK